MLRFAFRYLLNATERNNGKLNLKNISHKVNNKYHAISMSN